MVTPQFWDRKTERQACGHLISWYPCGQSARSHRCGSLSSNRFPRMRQQVNVCGGAIALDLQIEATTDGSWLGFLSLNIVRTVGSSFWRGCRMQPKGSFLKCGRSHTDKLAFGIEMWSTDSGLTEKAWLCSDDGGISSQASVVVGITEEWWRQHTTNPIWWCFLRTCYRASWWNPKV